MTTGADPIRGSVLVIAFAALAWWATTGRQFHWAATDRQASRLIKINAYFWAALAVVGVVVFLVGVVMALTGSTAG